MSIKLRKITETSLPQIMHWRMLPEISQYMYTDPKLTMESQNHWFNRIRNDDNVRYWIIEVDDIEIGVLDIVDIDLTNLRCCWAYYIADGNFRGRGLGKILECNIYDYVFHRLNLNKLWCEVFTFNDSVIKIHQKFGSEIEGILRQHIFKNGQFYDVVRMGITKDKWNSIKDNYTYERIEIE